MTRINIPSGSIWEDKVGYSRAVRIGNIIEIAGTTSADGDQIIGENDLYTQTRHILMKIEKTLIQTGATLPDVIRTRMFVTNIANWEEAGRAHGDFFGDIKPVTTMVEVRALIHPALLIEIEATAVINR